MTKQRALLIILLLGIIALLGAVVSILGGYVKPPSWLTSDPLRIWGLIAVLVTLTALFGYWVYRLQSGSDEQKYTLTPQNRRNLLAKVRFHLTTFFEDSLHEAALLALGLQKEPDAVANRGRPHVQHQDQPERSFPPGTRISTAFQEAGSALLVLGNPGAGKSTLLHELAADLSSLAETDKDQPIPVIFTLASWAEGRKPLDEWMVEALKQGYQIPNKIAQAWVQSDLLLPLLDGLDEVERAYRTACVEAINIYRKAHDVSLVVSCRREEYEELEQRVDLHTAVLVQPLTPAQIDEYLSNAPGQVEAVRQALHDDPDLKALAASPLMLNVMVLAYRKTPVDDLRNTPPAERQHRIFQAYVQSMLDPKPSNRFSQEPAIHWLGWLATEMTGRSQTEFYLEQMQPDWLPTPRSRLLYRTAVPLVVGLGGGLVAGLVGVLDFGLRDGLDFGLVAGLAAGLFFGLEPKIKPAEVLVWSRSGLVGGLFVGLGVGLAGGLGVGLVAGLFVGLFVGLLVGLLSGPSGGSLDASRRTYPNQGIRNSAINGTIVGLPFGLGVELVGGLAGGLNGRLVGGLGVGLVLGLGFFLLLFLYLDRAASVRHLVLRVLLWRAGCTPWRYIHFLNYARRCILLRRAGAGGGYAFIHPLLQEYFAGLS